MALLEMKVELIEAIKTLLAPLAPWVPFETLAGVPNALVVLQLVFRESVELRRKHRLVRSTQLAEV